MHNPQDVGPWGKTGDVEVATSPPPLRGEPSKNLDEEPDYSGAFAWLKYSFRFRGRLNKRNYLRLISIPSLMIFWAIYGCKKKLMPAFAGQQIENVNGLLTAYQSYIETLPKNEIWTIFIVSVFLIFCLYCIVIHTMKRLRDFNVNNILCFIIPFFGALIFFWPLVITVIIVSLASSQQDKKQGYHER